MKKGNVLKRLGFKITEDGITKNITREEDISPILNALVRNNFKIVDFKIQRPTLEDYFLKMVKKK